MQAATFRIVQEALTNVARYARPPRAAVSIHLTNGEAFIDVTDDGARRTGPVGRGSGIAGMRERAALAGGRLDAGPSPDGLGWRVHAVLPARKRASDDGHPRAARRRPGRGTPRAADDPRSRARHRDRRRGRGRSRGGRACPPPRGRPRPHGRPDAAHGRPRGHPAARPPRHRRADRRARGHDLRSRRSRLRRAARRRRRLPAEVGRARRAGRRRADGRRADRGSSHPRSPAGSSPSSPRARRRRSRTHGSMRSRRASAKCSC